MPTAALKFVEAYRAAHPIQAHALRLALEEAGIQVIIENEALQGAIGDVPPGWSSAPRLMVEESQLTAARDVIRQIDHDTQIKPDLALPDSTCCLACGSIMAEVESTCPNCGWTYKSNSSVESE